VLARLLWAPVCGVVAGGIAWSVVRVGLETADQLSSVIGGAVGLLGLAVSLLTLRSPAPALPTAAGDGGAGGRWVREAAAHASYRAPAVPAPVRGRDSQLADILHLAAGRDGGLVVVCGTGGLGKTTLAAQAARQAEEQGRAVFWVRWQDDAARLVHDLTRVVKELGLAETRLHDAQSGQAALVDVVWEHLAAVRGWMIVIDNVDTPRSLGPGSDPPGSYRGWVRPDGAGLLLVTVGDGTSFPSAAHLASYAGLAPTTKSSGTSIHGEHAPRGGNRQLKRAMFLSAFACMNARSRLPHLLRQATRPRQDPHPGPPPPRPPTHQRPVRHAPRRHLLRIPHAHGRRTRRMTPA
jgi:hypothetical protein